MFDRLYREKPQSKLYGINLKHNDLLRMHGLITGDEYHRGFIRFMKKYGVITCIKETFEPGKEARLYKVDLLNLCNIMNEVCKQSEYTFAYNPYLFKLKCSLIEKTPLVKAVINNFYYGQQAIYKDYSFDEEGIVYSKNNKEKHISENTFLVRYLSKLEECCPPVPKELLN